MPNIEQHIWITSRYSFYAFFKAETDRVKIPSVSRTVDVPLNTQGLSSGDFTEDCLIAD